jgi:hypothetical protein
VRSRFLGGSLAFGAVLLGTALFAGPGEETVQSAWTDQPVVIDGSRAEWQGASLTEWKKDAVAFAFQNDGETLYVLFVIKDPKFRSSIEANGITLYFAAGAAKVKDYGIRFKKTRLTPDEYISILEKQGPLPEEQKTSLRSKAGFVLFHHQVLDRKGRPVDNPGETAARPAIFKYAPGEKGELVYEFAVPLVRGSDLAAGVGAGAGQNVMVGFAWGGETAEMRKAAAKRQRQQADVANEEIGRIEGRIIGSVDSGPAPKRYDLWTALKLAERPS